MEKLTPLEITREIVAAVGTVAIKVLDVVYPMEKI